MDGLDIGLLSMVAIVVLIYAGMHVAIALCLVSLIGVWAIKGNFALAETLLALAASDAVSSYEFGVVPLFVLMGLLVSVAGIGRDTFVAANVLLRGMRGGLGVRPSWPMRPSQPLPAFPLRRRRCSQRSPCRKCSSSDTGRALQSASSPAARSSEC